MTKNLSCALLVLSLCFVGCDEPPTETEPENIAAPTEEDLAPQAPAIDLASIASRIGGLRMAVGQFGVELLPQSSGVLKAVVSDANGAAVQGAEVEVSMQGTDGQAHAVTLAWDASVEAYVGTMADASPAAGAATVSVAANGATAEVEVAAINVAPVPTYGGHVVLLGDIAAEVRPEADGVIYVSAQRPSGYLSADAGVDLKVSVTGADGAKVDCPLAWDPPSAAFVGVLPEGTTLANGALELTATVDGIDHVAGLTEVSVAAPTHDGDVVAVGDLAVELVPAADGKIDAYVTDASGAAVSAGADVSIEVAGVDTPVVLAWDEAAGAYKGEVAADVDVSTAPMVVVVDHGGRARRGGIACAAGRAFGVTWRSRVESGAGGAIPPGQEMRLASNAEVRGRVSGSVEVDVAAPEAEVEVAVSAMRGRAAAAMANARAEAEAARARAAAVNAQGQSDRARAQAEAAQRARVRVQTPRAPMAPMFSAGASTMGSSSSGMASGSASVMVGF